MESGHGAKGTRLRQYLGIAAAAALLLLIACDGDSEPQATSTAPAEQSGEPDLPANPKGGTIEDAQSSVDFALWVPADVPPELEFYTASYGEYGTKATLWYRQGEGDYVVSVAQSTGDIVLGDPSSPVEVQGTSGSLVRGEDINNPGLVVIEWRKDGITFVAHAFPDDDFTEEEFLRFLNSLEPVDRQG